MNYQLSKIRKVINPCLDIISIHKHTNGDPISYEIVTYNGGKYSRKDFNNILDKKGLKRTNISFSKIT